MPRRNKRRLTDSFRDAFRGVWLCLLSERNMRIHALACGYVVFFAVKTRVSRGEMAVLLLAMGMVTAAEALNTSIEKLCDFVHPNQERRIGAVKDMAAGGVVLSAGFAALAGIAILARPALWQVLADLTAAPWKLALFVATLIAGGLLVFWAPLRRG